MAIDGVLLHFVVDEIKNKCLNSRVDKIYQPMKDVLVLFLRSQQGNVKLLLNAGADSPRIHITEQSIENPKNPPMFCMIMRKHLCGSKLIDVSQIGFDRVVTLRFETYNEMGDKTIVSLICEIMGRHSNIIAIDSCNRIIDAIKHVNYEMSQSRPVLPGFTYSELPVMCKKSILEDIDDICNDIVKINKPLSKAIVDSLCGISPFVGREISLYVTRGEDIIATKLNADLKDRLSFIIKKIRLLIEQHKPIPTSVIDENGKPMEFSYLQIKQYGVKVRTREFNNFATLMDEFYFERDRVTRVKQRSSDLIRLLFNTHERIERKLNAQMLELSECENRFEKRKYGELLTANIYLIDKGMESITVSDYYENPPQDVTIPIDPRLSPSQNAQKYYKEYRKLETAFHKLSELIEQEKIELEYIDSVFDLVTRTNTVEEINAIRMELAEQGYLKKKSIKKQKDAKLDYLKYISTDGFVILSGRNNIQNDRLTLKDSQKNDVWFHSHQIPGSHVVIVSQGRTIPNKTLEEAAIIAAYNSKARESSKVAVDYTEIKNIKKPNGARPGMVVYDTYNTVYVDPDMQLVKELIETN